MTTYYQVELFSQMEKRWLALFSRVESSAEAEKMAREWVSHAPSRVVKVTQSEEVEWVSEAVTR